MTALVTGASRGIGRALAGALAARGADVVLTGRSLDRLREAAAGFADHDGKAHCMELDLADPGDVERFARDYEREIGKLDALIHCAAVYQTGAWAEATADDLDAHYRTNVRGAYALTQKMLPSLIAAGGDVVFMNSSVVDATGAGIGQYAATKHALIGLANSLRAEVNEHGVRVLSVFPGRTATPLQEAIHKGEGKAYRPEKLLQPGDVADVVLACLSLPDTAEVTELHIRPRQKY